MTPFAQRFTAIGLALLLAVGGAAQASWAEDATPTPTAESTVPAGDPTPDPDLSPPSDLPTTEPTDQASAPADLGASNPPLRPATPSKKTKTSESPTPTPPTVDPSTPTPSDAPAATHTPTPTTVAPQLWNTNYTESNTPAGQSMLAIVALIGSLILAALLGGGAFLYKKLLADRLPRKPFSRSKGARRN